MTSFFKKLMATGTALSLGLSAMAFADQNGAYVYNGGYNNCCPQPNNCNTGCNSWCDNLKFDVSFLWWKLSGDELDYAYDITSAPVDGADLTLNKKRYHDVSGDYAPGFKIGLGVDLPCICWDTNIEWTHFDTKNSDKHEFDYKGGTTVSIGIPFFKDSETDLGTNQRCISKGKINFDYDVIDLEFGKWLCCNNCLLFRPHIGLRAVDISEKFHSELDLFSTNSSVATPDYAAHVHNEFKGLGVRAGLDTDLVINDCWSITGRAAASIVWGNTKIRNHFARYTSIDSEDVDQISYEKESYHHSRAFTDLSLGIRYRNCICQCPFSLEAAWEHHYLFNQHRFFASDFLDSEEGYNFKKNGDISLQGLTVTASFEF